MNTKEQGPNFINFHAAETGGLGVSTTMLNVGALLAASGRSTLLVDLNFVNGGLTNWAIEKAIKSPLIRPLPNLVGMMDFLRSYLDGDSDVFKGKFLPDRLYKLKLPEDFLIPGVSKPLHLLQAGRVGHIYYREELDDLTHLVYQNVPRLAIDLEHELDFRQIAQEFRKELTIQGNFDYILVDSPAGMTWETTLAEYLTDHEILFCGLNERHYFPSALHVLEDVKRFIIKKSDDTMIGSYVSDGKLLLVAAMTPSGRKNKEGVQTRIDGLEKAVKGIIAPLPSLDEADKGTFWNRRTFNILHIDYAGLLPEDELVVTHQEWNKSRLANTYQWIRHSLSTFCHDDIETLLGQAQEAWRRKDYGKIVSSLVLRKGILLTDMPNVAALAARTYQFFIRSNFERLMELPPDEFTGARVVAEYVAQELRNQKMASRLRNRL